LVDVSSPFGVSAANINQFIQQSIEARAVSGAYSTTVPQFREGTGG